MKLVNFGFSYLIIIFLMLADSRAKAVKNVDKMMEQNTGSKIRADFDNAEGEIFHNIFYNNFLFC